MCASIVGIPNVLLREVGLFLVASELLRLCRVCRDVWKRGETIMISFASNEQARMRIQIVPFQIRLTIPNVVEQWRQFAPRMARAVRDALDGQPLVFYSGRFDPATVLLEETTLAVRNNSENLSMLAMQEEDISRAVILARSISNDATRHITLGDLALRPGVPLLTSLRIARRITSMSVRSATLRAISRRADVPLKKALVIASSIRMETIREAALKDLALKNGMPIQIALEIACSISAEAVKRAILRELARRQG